MAMRMVAAATGGAKEIGFEAAIGGDDCRGLGGDTHEETLCKGDWEGAEVRDERLDLWAVGDAWEWCDTGVFGML